MYTRRNVTVLLAPAVVLAVLAAPRAAAETLIYITQTTIGTVDSSSPATDNTSSNKNAGPLNYTLPNGSSMLGAEVSPQDQTLYMLVALSGGDCQLYAVNTTGSGGVAAVSAASAAAYPCSAAPGAGDIAFLDGGAGSSAVDAYLVANGEGSVLDVPAGGGTPASYTISNPGGGVPNIWGLAQGASPGGVLYGVDAGTHELFQLTLDPATMTGTETDLAQGSVPVTFAGTTSFDYSSASGTYYLYTNSELYAYQGAFPNNLSAGDVSILGDMPAGTLVMAVANGTAVSNNSGALGPATLLPLLGMALLRRRRSARKAGAAVRGQADRA